MIYLLSGTIQDKKDDFAIVDVQGVGYRVFMPKSILQKLPQAGAAAKIFCFMNVREDGMELYGFLSERERGIFEMLTSVSGVGPKTALRVMDVATVSELAAAVQAGNAELLTKASGVGRKTAERVVVELRGKMAEWAEEGTAQVMAENLDVTEALVNLGYAKSDVREALSKIDPALAKVEDRLRAALKLLKK